MPDFFILYIKGKVLYICLSNDMVENWKQESQILSIIFVIYICNTYAFLGRVHFGCGVECRWRVSRRRIQLAQGVGALRFGIVVIVFKWRSCRRQLLTCPLDAARGQPYFRIGRWASFARICAGYFKQCNHTYFARWLHLGQTRASVDGIARDDPRSRLPGSTWISRKRHRNQYQETSEIFSPL